MKKLCFFIVGLFMSFFSFAQMNEGWVEIGNASYNSKLYDIEFVSANTGYAVGSGGAFLKTTDGGQNWTAFDIGVGYDLHQIQFTSSQIGYILGGNDYDGGYFGRVLRTVDAGATWSELLTQSSSLIDMCYINDSIGWVSYYNNIHLTTDSGSTWTTINQPSVLSIFNIAFVSQNRGYYVGNGNMYVSTDGGNTWASHYAAGYVQDLWFRTPAEGYFVNTASDLQHTSDSGKTWSSVGSTIVNFSKIRFLSASLAFGVDYNSEIYVSTNGGLTWASSYQSIGRQIFQIEVSPSGSLLATGEGGLILETTNGLVWDTLHIGTFSGELFDVEFLTNDIGIAAGSNGIIKRTTDGGNSWTIESVHPYKNVKGITVVSPSLVYIVCDDSLILKSTDSCQTWTNSSTGFYSYESNGIVMYSATEGFALAQNDIYKTNDGGLNWVAQGINSIKCAFVLNDDSVYFGGSFQTFYTHDGGTTYSSLFTASQIVNGIYFLSADTGFMVNHWGRIYKSVNAGSTWSQILNHGSNLHDITMFDDTTFYAVGHNGGILKSTNRGVNWVQIESPTMRRLRSIHFTPDGTGYIVGSDGVILRKSIVPTYDIDFLVLNDDGDTLTNATMNFNSSTYPQGVYQVNGLQSASYDYIFSCLDHQNDTGSVTVNSDSTFTVVLKKYHSVTVRVENVFNAGIGGAQVIVGNDTLVSNAAGEALFVDVLKNPALAYQLSEANYITQNGIFSISGDTTFLMVLQANLTAPLLDPVSGLADHEFTVNWTASSGAASYTLFVSDDNFVSHITGYDSLICTGTSQLVSGLTAGQNYQFRLRALNSYGYSPYSTIGTAATTTAIDELSASALKVYPNPAQNTLIISFDLPVNDEITIYNSVGMVVMVLPAMQEQQVDVSGLSQGLYFVRSAEHGTMFIKN